MADGANAKGVTHALLEFDWEFNQLTSAGMLVCVFGIPITTSVYIDIKGRIKTFSYACFFQTIFPRLDVSNKRVLRLVKKILIKKPFKESPTSHMLDNH